MLSEETIRCSSCKITKPVCSFYKNSKVKSGRQSMCKTCRVEYTKKYRAENRDKIVKYQQAYYEIHKAEMQKYYAKYRAENKERMCELQKNWRRKHKKIHAANNKKWQEQHQIELTEYNKMYYRKNKEKIQEQRKLAKLAKNV